MTMRLTGWLTAAAAMLLANTIDTRSTTPLDVRISPVHSYAPALVRIRVNVEPAQDNRKLVIAAESENFFRSSDIPLAGDRAPRVHEMLWDGLPPGEYVLEAALHGPQGERAADRAEFVVIDGTGRP